MGLTPLQRSNWCFFQPQPTGQTQVYKMQIYGNWYLCLQRNLIFIFIYISNIEVCCVTYEREIEIIYESYACVWESLILYTHTYTRIQNTYKRSTYAYSHSTNKHTRAQTQTQIQAHTHTNTNTRVHTHTNKQTHTQTHTQTNIHSHTDTRSTHTLTHIQAHTLLQQCSSCLVRLTWIVFVMGGRWPYS